MELVVILLADVVLVSVMVLGVYFRRHRRRDMLLAYFSLNVGVMAVTLVLASAPVAAGLGLGLFGVLSIIRLRSSALTQEEVAYYFASLALGLVAGLRPDPWWVGPTVSGLVVLVVYAADHPRLHARSRQQVITLDVAVTDEQELRGRLEALLHATVQRFVVTETDLVRDLTVVDVRYRLADDTLAAPQRTGAQPATADPGLAPVRMAGV
ncbi:DUF4956 domain-containing protein [Nocardioides gansuensis]|uniref:DUF4956 domain-containing protein n=1 Tax=Nocardioides gansuensis TaxID=2138300 RepID=A0A2T8FEB9_9ACTN|nr:DUF4956 domain-containing protein [Nocardioides gansuensis]PVG84043.1 DUF4956 domain-containing protein [Nocardioides gansuensis]